MALTKINFDHTVITSKFLNDIQDAVIALEKEPRLLIFNENTSKKVLPNTSGTSLSGLGTSYLFPVVTPRVGDVLYGNKTNYLATVTAVSGTTMTVAGTGQYIF